MSTSASNASRYSLQEASDESSKIIFSGKDQGVWQKWTEEIEHKLDRAGEGIAFELWNWDVEKDLIDEKI